MFLMRAYLIFTFNDSSFKFLDYNLENLVFKFLLIFTSFIGCLYVPFMKERAIFISDERLPLRKPFLLLSNLPLISI